MNWPPPRRPRPPRRTNLPERGFVEQDADWIEEIQITCPACKAASGAWCDLPGDALGLHNARITAYAWRDWT